MRVTVTGSGTYSPLPVPEQQKQHITGAGLTHQTWRRDTVSSGAAGHFQNLCFFLDDEFSLRTGCQHKNSLV